MAFDLNSGLLTVILVLLAWIKADQISLWKRVNNHTHKVECKKENGVCRIEADGVILSKE